MDEMEPLKRVTLNYSLKNIPIPPNDLYKKKPIEMSEIVMKRMRWKVFFSRGTRLRRTSETMGSTMDLTAVVVHLT